MPAWQLVEAEDSTCYLLQAILQKQPLTHISDVDWFAG